MKKFILLLIAVFICSQSQVEGRNDQKDDLKMQYEGAFLNLALSTTGDGFYTEEDVLAMLRSMQRFWEKKPISEEERFIALRGYGLVVGVYQGFLKGIFVENSRQTYNSTKQVIKVSPLCAKEEITVKDLVRVGIEMMEKDPKETRKIYPGEAALAHAFLSANFYQPCKPIR